MAAIGKFPNAIGKLIIGKTLPTNEEQITNAMIGNDVLVIYWFTGRLCKVLDQIGNDW